MFAALVPLLAFLLLLASPARAETVYGLAMHGTPKYGRDFTHLDYANPAAPKGGQMIQGALGTFDTLNPFNIKGIPAQGLSLVYDRLMQRVWDEPFTMYPLIAQSADVPEDRSSITFHLDPRAKFSDGSLITADDVIFTFETLRVQGRPNMRRVYGLVSKVEKKGERTVHFALGPGHDRETVMILAMMPVLSKTWWTSRPFDQTTLDIPVSNGPYKILSLDPGRKIVYQRDPAYWAGSLPVNVGHNNVDKIIYDYYRDDTVAFEAFKSGAIDFRREFDAGNWATGYDFPAVKDGRVIREAIRHGRPEKVRSFIFNTRRPPFDDPKLRQALGLVLDFEWMNENLFHGLFRRINSVFPNSVLASGSWTPPRHDTPEQVRTHLREADRLLKESGWVIVNGKRAHEKDSTKFLSFEILIGAPDDEKIALAYARSLKRLGIEARVRVLDAAAFTGRLNEYDFDMVLHHWLSTLSPGSEQILYWGCAAAQEKSRWNFPGICVPAIDALALSIAQSKTYEELTARARALDSALMAGHYMVPLAYSGQDFVAYRKDLRHPATIPVYGIVPETWWIAPVSEEKDK